MKREIIVSLIAEHKRHSVRAVYMMLGSIEADFLTDVEHKATSTTTEMAVWSEVSLIRGRTMKATAFQCR